MSRSSYHPTDVMPGRGAGAGVGVAALTGLLFAAAFVGVRIVQTSAGVGEAASAGFGAMLALAVLSGVAATPLTALAGTVFGRSSRRVLVAGYTVAAAASVALVPGLFSVFPGLLDEAVLVASGACAVAAAAVAALFVTRPQRTRESRTLRPGATIDPAQVTAQRGGGVNPASMTGPSPTGL
jgi:hypothetical protein